MKRPADRITAPSSPPAQFIRIVRGEHAGEVVPVLATEVAKWHRVQLADGSLAWVHRGDVEWVTD
jgi:SH3-like domain-containing protein